MSSRALRRSRTSTWPTTPFDRSFLARWRCSTDQDPPDRFLSSSFYSRVISGPSLLVLLPLLHDIFLRPLRRRTDEEDEKRDPRMKSLKLFERRCRNGSRIIKARPLLRLPARRRTNHINRDRTARRRRRRKDSRTELRRRGGRERKRGRLG